MRKIYAIVVASLLTFTANSFAEMGMGITANYAMTSTSGTETLRDSGKVTNATHDEDVTIPELFSEVIGDQGVFGLAYVPVTELGSKSRTDSNSEGSSGTYKGSAEISDHVTVYADWNLSEFMGSTVYVTGGISRATLTTLESVTTGGSVYGDEDVFGYTVGLGAKGDLPFGNGLYYKASANYTEYDSYEDSASTNNNKITADTEVTSFKGSIGFKF